jgi:hypothetical protein
MARHSFPPGRPDPRDLEKLGARLEIEVGPPIIRRSRTSLAAISTNPGSGKFARMPALIDIGAGRTVLTPLAIKRLDLPLVDYVDFSRAGGMDRAGVYVASFHFPRYKLSSIDVIQVLCCEIPEQPIQCLIGRDVLSRWTFTYNGQNGEWSIEEEEFGAPTTKKVSWVEPPVGASYDVFVSHASEDKGFVEPLVFALKSAGVDVWYDKDQMKWGDNLRSSIDDGLLNSRFGIVVLSKAFLKKKRWTEHELNGLLAKERDGKKVILPIWHEITQDDLSGYSVTFVDRIGLDSRKNSLQEMVSEMQSLLSRTRQGQPRDQGR